jgi:integrase
MGPPSRFREPWPHYGVSPGAGRGCDFGTRRPYLQGGGVREIRCKDGPTRPHDLRHGWATRALEAGLSPKVVQEILGHASSQVNLDVYSDVVPAMKTDATQLVADLIAGKR